MTKERKIEILKDLLIQLSDSANILCTCEADERCEVVEEYIKTLEQQSSDCVSRADLYKILKLFGEQPLENDITTDLIYLVKDSDIVELPPVTPTHGTCKDCKYNVKDKRTTTMCDIGHRFFMRIPDTFYCADFEKRGNKDGSN